MKKILFFLVLVHLLTFSAKSSSWYVDNAIPNSGNGTSWNTALKNFSDLPLQKIQAGDFIYISGGPSKKSQTYTESWRFQNVKGLPDKPVTIAIDAKNKKHNGTVVFDFDAKGDSALTDGILFSNNDYITFTGNVKGSNHIVFKNLRNIFNRMTARCITGNNNTAIIFDHLDMINCNNGIVVSYRGGSNEIRYCNFTQIRGDAALSVRNDGRNWDEMKIHDNTIETLVNNTPPPGKKSYGGPDGIQCSGGMSAYRNVLKVSKTKVYTSTQHPDMFQLQGDFLQIYDNLFTNVGDSNIDYDCYNNSTPHDVRIYNNVFHVVDIIDAYPDFFRLYISNSNPLKSISNFKILNNTFAENTGLNGEGFIAVRFNGFKDNNPSGSGNEIKNNIFFNCGNGAQYQIIYIAPSKAFDENSFSFDANIYYNSLKAPFIYYNGINYSAKDWIASKDPRGKISAPEFVRYSPNDAKNDFHLAPNDKAAKDSGISLENYFKSDKDEVDRTKGKGWSIGAYEQ